MPTSLIGFVLFLILLTPGLVFFTVRDRRVPQRDLSAFRETGAVLLASVVCDTFTIALFGVGRVLLPRHTLDVGALARNTDSYLRENFLEIWWWGLALLAVASFLAFVLARFGGLNWGSSPITFVSAWHRLFADIDDAEIHCGCQLDDGSWVSGYLGSYSTEVTETVDRDLVLLAPIAVRTREEEAQSRAISAVVISARRLVRLEVSYLPIGSIQKARAGAKESPETIDW